MNRIFWLAGVSFVCGLGGTIAAFLISEAVRNGIHALRLRRDPRTGKVDVQLGWCQRCYSSATVRGRVLLHKVELFRDEHFVIAVGPLCDRCWAESSVEERLKHYRTFWATWGQHKHWRNMHGPWNYDGTRPEWDEVERAVRAAR